IQGTRVVPLTEARKQVLGERHSSTLIDMYNLGQLFFDRSQLGKVEALQIQTLAANKQVFGEAHRETLGALRELTATYEMMGPERERELAALRIELDELKPEGEESGEGMEWEPAEELESQSQSSH
ncbi:hypothetical protein FRC09_017922, partial [Ceratobasidium sp. 395]